jgi:glycosyltransferase involved in cell wall biosynthesis
MDRNSLCSCGSGKRFKQCCGIVDSSQRFRNQALAAQRAGALGQAEILYRRAVAGNPDDIDALHMLGVVLLERMRYSEALGFLSEAAVRTGWHNPAIRVDLGKVLAGLLSSEANRRQEALLAEFAAWESARRNARIATFPLVSVVLPAYNHARYVAEAIASVTAQTYPRIELVIIDDGSTDGSEEVIAKCIANVSLPVRFIARENRGAPATLNEGAALAQGQYLSFLNSDDYYAPDRISTLVKEVADAGAQWGFSLVYPIVEGPQPDQADEVTSAGQFLQKQRSLLGRYSNSFSFIGYNVAVSTGNLFVDRALFRELGGFRDYRHDRDWDFCLRAGALAEPIAVHRPLYFYRKHESNTIDGDAYRVSSDFLETALSNSAEWRNPLAPHAPTNRWLLLGIALSTGMGGLVSAETLRSVTEQLQARLPSRWGSANALSRLHKGRKTAIVVLGMHRSGTSSLARVLNLCGAALPANLMPPKLDDNPTGYWEPAEITELNVRVLRRLAATWDNVAYLLPDTGEFVDDFKQDVRTLLASEYGNEETILIKDPRISVLAPLWHIALMYAGYRPAYVVLVRHPLEVARSLRARGDMSVRKGLLLWLTYMNRIADFAGAREGVVHIRFTSLLEDWRGIIEKISDRLDVRLDLHTHAEEINQFLEPTLRRQVSDDEALSKVIDDSELGEIRSLYQRFLARCDRDAGLTRDVFSSQQP